MKIVELENNKTILIGCELSILSIYEKIIFNGYAILHGIHKEGTD